MGARWDPEVPTTCILHLIDASGTASMVSIPIEHNVGVISWQRLAP